MRNKYKDEISMGRYAEVNRVSLDLYCLANNYAKYGTETYASSEPMNVNDLVWVVPGRIDVLSR